MSDLRGSAGGSEHAPGAEAISIESLLEIEASTLDRTQEMIRAVDAKTPILMAIQTAMLGALVACLPDRQDCAPTQWFWLSIGAAFPLVGILFSTIATFPRTRARQHSLLFFGTIASMSPQGYAAAVRRRTESEHLDDLIAQVHRNAEIAHEKYLWVTRSMLATFAGVVAWTVAVLFLLRA